MNKDFYDRLPGVVCITLDNLIKIYSSEDWFSKAWEEYRQHVLKSTRGEMRMPGFVFSKYLGG